MEENSDDVPVVQRRRRRISRHTREQTPEPSTGRIEYHNSNNNSNSNINNNNNNINNKYSNDENSSLDRSSDNLPSADDGKRRSDSKRSIIRSALNFSGHKNKILNMRDKKIHASSIRSQSQPRDEKIIPGTPEIFSLLRRAKRSISAPRKRDESSDSGKFSVNSQDRVIADITKRTSQTYETIHKQFEKHIPTDDKKSAQLEANLAKFNDDRRKFELEKLRFLQEKRELDRLRLRRFERYKQDLPVEANDYSKVTTTLPEANESSAEKVNTLEDKQRQERLQNMERQEKQEQQERLEKTKRQEKQYRLEQQLKREKREQQEKIEKQERLEKIERERQEKLLSLKSRIECSVDRQEKQDRPQVRRRRNIKNYESTSTCSSSGDDEFVSSAISDSSSRKKSPVRKREASKVRSPDSTKISVERSVEKSSERTVKKALDDSLEQSIERSSERDVPKSTDRTSAEKRIKKSVDKSVEGSAEKEIEVLTNNKPSEVISSDVVKKAEDLEKEKLHDSKIEENNKDADEEKQIKMKTKSLFRAVVSDLREFFGGLKNFIKQNPKHIRAIKLHIRKCLAYLILFIILCGVGGIIFRFTEGSFESQYKCGVKRIKRDFIDQLWLSSHNLR